MTLVCIGNEFGQLGNRLVRAAHVLAFCREHGFGFLDLPFTKYARHLAVTSNSIALSSPRLPVPASVAGRFQHRILYDGPNWGQKILGWPLVESFRRRHVHEFTLPTGNYCDLSQSEIADEFRKYRVVVLNGWFFRGYSLVRTHADWLRTFLRPNVSDSDAACRAVDDARNAGDIAVGIHIRGGDYRTWRDGQFFYPLEFYREQMRRAVRELAPRSVIFFVTSNEPIETDVFNDFNCVLARGRYIESDLVSDLAALSRCDMILGPPSTYSLWAAFLGRAALWHVTSAEEMLSVEKFKPVPDLSWVLEKNRNA